MAPRPAIRGANAIDTPMEKAADLSSSAAPYAPRPKYAACPNEYMPPGPIMKCRLSAKSDATMTSSSSTGAYGNKPDSKGRKTRAARTPKMNTRNGAELGLNGASIGAELRLAASGYPRTEAH